MADLDTVEIGERIELNPDQLESFTPVEQTPVGGRTRLSEEDLVDFEPVNKTSPSQQYYREDTSGLVEGELGLQGKELEFLDDTQNRGVNPEEFVGFTTVGAQHAEAIGKGLVTSFARLPQVQTGFGLEFVDQFRQEFNEELGVMDLLQLVVPFGASPGEARAIDEKIGIALGFGDRKKSLAKIREIETAVLETDRKNKEFLERNNLIRPEEGSEGVAFDIGSVGGSIAQSIGLAYLTRSPSTAAFFFGGMQKSDLYKEARDKGFSPDEASLISNLGGWVEGGIEFIGVNQFMKAATRSKGLRLVLFRAAEEAVQEGTQTAAEEILTQTSGLRELDVKGAVGRVLYSMALGGIGGGTVAGSIEIGKRVGKEEGLSEETITSLTETYRNNEQAIREELGQIISDEVSPLKDNPENAAKVADILKKFQTGQEIDLSEVDSVQAEELGKLVKKSASREARIKEETKTKKLRSLGIEATRDNIKILQTGFRKAQTALRQDIADNQKIFDDSQKEIRAAVNNLNLREADRKELLGLVDRAFAGKTRKVQTPAQLQRVARDLQQELENAITKRRKFQVRKAVEKTLKRTKIKRQSGKPIGKFTPEIQEQLDNLRGLLGLTKKQAQEELDKRLEEEAGIPTPQQALENLILSARADVTALDIDQLENLTLQLEGIIEEGKNISSLANLKKQEAIENLQSELIELTAVPEAVKKDGAIKNIFRGLNNTFLAQSGAWRQKIKYVLQSKNADAVEDFLAKISLTEETRKFEIGKQDQITAFTKLAMERTGINNQRNLLKRLSKDSSEVVLDETFTHSDGKRRRITLTRSEARKRVMEFADPVLLESMKAKQGNAYTEEIITAIRSSLDDTDFQLVQAQLDYYANYYNRINETYRKLFGVNLPQIEFYSPIKRQFKDEDVDEFLKGILYRGGVAPGSLKSRKPNVRPVRQSGDLNVFYSHIAEMEYFIAYAEKVNILQRAFSNPKVQKTISDSVGDEILKTINADLDWFAKKGVRDSIAGEKMLRTLARNFSLSQLAAKPQIGLKQLTSLWAYSDKVKIKDFVEGLTIFAANPKKALNVLRESSLWQNRGINLDKDFQDVINDKSFLNVLGKNPTLLNWLMTPIRWGDKGAIGLGGYGYYHALRKQGKTHEQALKAFERKTSETQQSTDPDQMSELQRSNGIIRILVQFMSSPNALMRAEYEGIIDFKRGRTSKAQLAKTLLIFHLLIPNVFQIVANGFSWDDEDQLRASMLGSLNGILLWSNVLEAAVSFGISGEFFEAGVRHPADFINSILQAIDSYDEEDIELEGFLEGARSIEKGLDGVGKLFGIPLKTFYNALVGADQVIKAENSDEVVEGGARLLGYSPYTIDKKILNEDE